MLDERWGLSPLVALRPESFGALAYHFGSRRLTFLKRIELLRVVQRLGSEQSVREALVAAEVPATEHEAYAHALHQLAAVDMIRPRPLEVSL